MATRLNDIIREALKRGSDTAWVLDGQVTGTIDIENPPPIRAINKHQVVHIDRYTSRVPNAVIDGLFFDGGIRNPNPALSELVSNRVCGISTPGCEIRDCRITNFGSAFYEIGIGISGSAAAGLVPPAVVDGNLLEDFGGIANTPAILLGFQAADEGDLPLGHYVAIVSNNTIRNQTDVLTDPGVIPIQFFWNAYVVGNRVSTWNCAPGTGTGIHCKAGGCWIRNNTMDNEFGTGAAGALYDRLTSKSNNLWAYNHVRNMIQGSEHYGSSDTVWEHNVFENCENNCFVHLNSGADFSNLIIRNTTIWRATSGSGGRGIHWSPNAGFTGTGFQFYDNIYDKNGDGSGVSSPQNVDAIPSGLYTATNSIYAGNFVHPNGGGAPAHPAGDATSWADAIAAGQVPPLTALADLTAAGLPLVDPANGDFNLRNEALTAPTIGGGNIGADWPNVGADNANFVI